MAWAKPDGKELRDIMTLRFSSIMVLLSLLLGSEMGVLFNPNKTTTAMRDAMDAQDFGDFKFWIGVTIWMSACVTVVGIIATFSAWGMVAAISPENAHCLLRSSIGQYVTNLPAAFVVASLYLFLIWLVLFMFLMMKGFLSFLLLLFAAYLFFIVVIPLSAFGRLIMHTGAMSSTKVIDPELEKRLLPSGLHASLLIKATHRKHTRTSAVSQYRTTSVMKRENQDEDDFGIDGTETTYGSTSGGPSRPALVQLPRPSVLNTMHVNNLRTVVQKVLFLQHTPATVAGDDVGDIAVVTQAPMISISEDEENLPGASRNSQTLRHRSSILARQSLNNISRGQLKRASRNQALREWDEDNNVRELYDLPPPAELEEEDDEDDLEGQFDSLYSTSSAKRESTINETQQLLPK